MLGKYVTSNFEFTEEFCLVEGVEGVDRISDSDVEASAEGSFTITSYDAYDLALSSVVASGIITEIDVLLLAVSHKEWLRGQPHASEQFDKVMIEPSVGIPHTFAWLD